MIGRADIEGSKSNVAMNAWLPQASYPCGNFSDTSSWTFLRPKGSIGHVFTVCIRTENQNQVSFYPFVLHEISVLIELTLGHLCYCLTDVPPQPNSLPDVVSCVPQTYAKHLNPEPITWKSNRTIRYRISKTSFKVAVFHWCRSSRLYYTFKDISQRRIRVKLNRVFFPRWLSQARSLGCGFAR